MQRDGEVNQLLMCVLSLIPLYGDGQYELYMDTSNRALVQTLIDKGH